MKVSSGHSIFTAEAIAIYEAIKYTVETNNEITVILSDSLAVLNSLQHPTVISHKTNPLVIKIKHLVRENQLLGRQIHFIWVKAHVGLNEKVDEIAKQSVFSECSSVYKLCLTDTSLALKRSLKDKWNYLWYEFCFTNPSRYTLIHPEIPTTYWHENLNIPRKFITTIIRLKFGHACYPVHLFKIKVLPSNKCTFCDAIGDLDHIFFECPNNFEESNNLYQNLIKCNIQAPVNLLSLLALDNRQIFNAVIEFLKSTNMKF